CRADPRVADRAHLARGFRSFDGGEAASRATRVYIGYATRYTHVMTAKDSHQPLNQDGNARARVLLVTGMSGAGRSTALKALEDMGYEVFDNLPLSLVPALIEGAAADAPAI